MLKQQSAISGVVYGVCSGAGAATAGAVTSGLGIACAAGASGLLAGGVIGDRLTSGRRKLTDEELAYSREIFRDSVELERVTITRDSMISLGAPKGTGRVIHLKSDWDHFIDDTMQLSERGMRVLIHELGHVWQYQNGGVAYMHRSLWCQYRAWRKHGDRNAAYNWQEAVESQRPWEKWNPEQQATLIEDYNIVLRRVQSGEVEEGDESQLALTSEYMENVWNRFGAPKLFR